MSCKLSEQSTDMAMKEKIEKETEGNYSKKNSSNNMWHTSRDIHCKSFKGTCSYIEEISILIEKRFN